MIIPDDAIKLMYKRAKEEKRPCIPKPIRWKEGDHEYEIRESDLLIAERLSKFGAPCQYQEYVPQVETFCDKDHKNGACNPVECWAHVLKNIAENGKSNG